MSELHTPISYSKALALKDTARIVAWLPGTDREFAIIKFLNDGAIRAAMWTDDGLDDDTIDAEAARVLCYRVHSLLEPE